jgi:acetyl esterase/lipase
MAGAWCLHLPNLYRRFVTRLSSLTGLRVLLPDYRLAPEYPFPAAVTTASRSIGVSSAAKRAGGRSMCR